MKKPSQQIVSSLFIWNSVTLCITYSKIQVSEDEKTASDERMIIWRKFQKILNG